MLTNGELGTLDPRSSEDDSEGEELEVEEMAREVREMAESILAYRRTVPGRLAEALASALVAQRPVLPPLRADFGLGNGRIAEKEPSGTDGTSVSEASVPEVNKEMLEKICILRTKASGVIEAVPKLLERMNDCIKRSDKLNQSNVNIRPVFRKKRKY